MTIKYQPEVVQQYADKLYAKARGVAARYALAVGVVCGGLLAFILSRTEDVAGIGFVVGFGAGAVVGAIFGWEKAFAFRLTAQLALCQLQTEINTRVTALAAQTSALALAPASEVPRRKTLADV